MKRFVVAAMAITAMVVSGPIISFAEEEQTEPPGKKVFERNCSPCHGMNAKGGGPVAKYLTQQPPDLTQLTLPDGHFPAIRVEQTIDGRETSRVHGVADMPVWGKVLPAVQVKQLTQYLASIQEKKPASSE